MFTRHSAIVLGVVAVLASVGAYCAGRRVHLGTAPTSIAAQLDTNRVELHTDSLHRDTTRHAAVVSLAHTDSQRVLTRHVEDRVQIVGDSAVALERAVQRTDSMAPDTSALHPTFDLGWVVTVLDTIPIPPIVVTELRADREQITQDSVTIALWMADEAALDTIATRLNDRARLLEAQDQADKDTALVRGLKIGVVAGALVALLGHALLR